LGLAALIPTLPLYFLIGWAMSTIAAYVNAKYRDYPQMMGLFMQAMWYVSPVFFQESMFQNNSLLFMWFRLNPVTHLLHLIRKPFLDGIFPSLADYGVAFVMIAVFGCIAVWLNRRNEKTIIFYL
jgi:lipopolysaccharide transport system permease protein